MLKVRRLDQVVGDNIEDAPTFTVYPDSWWVEANFKPEFLGTAQRLAIEYWDPVKVNGR